MAKKPKQTTKTKKEEGKKKKTTTKSTPAHSDKKKVVQKKTDTDIVKDALKKLPKNQDAPPVKAKVQKKDAPAEVGKKKQPSHHIDVWSVGLVLFGLAIMFTLLLSAAFATGIKQKAQNVSGIIVSSIQETITSEPVVIDNRTEALDGTLHELEKLHYPVAIMIDNLQPARPQSNIQQASVVYETLVESGITRFMAIFDHEDVDKIGPIRSARPYYVQWADALDAMYMHAGGSPEALLKIQEYAIKDANAGRFYWRDNNRPAPHNLYTSSDLITKALRDYEWADLPQTFSRWSFDDDPDTGSLDTGGNIDLYFAGSAESSHVRWEYDPALEMYRRFQAGIPHDDAGTLDQIKAKTIVVQVIPPIVAVGSKGRLTLDIIGEGTAHVIFNGKRFEGTWTKPDITTRTKFFDGDGNEITFPRGNIFVEAIPSDKEVTFE